MKLGELIQIEHAKVSESDFAWQSVGAADKGSPRGAMVWSAERTKGARLGNIRYERMKLSELKDFFIRWRW